MKTETRNQVVSKAWLPALNHVDLTALESPLLGIDATRGKLVTVVYSLIVQEAVEFLVQTITNDTDQKLLD